MSDLFGRARIAELEARIAQLTQALDLTQGLLAKKNEENQRLLCKINPQLKEVFFPQESTPIVPVIDNGPACRLELSAKKIRFCGIHAQDLDTEGRCPVTEQTLFRKLPPKTKHILGSEFCRSRDEKFDQEIKTQ